MASKRAGRWRLALLVVLGLAAVFAIYRYTLHRMVESKLDEIRKQGYPVTLTEYDKSYPQVPSSNNAADVYLKAFQHYATSEADTNLPIVGFANLPPRDTPVPMEMKQEIAGYLGANQKALDYLHQAAIMQLCRYPSDLSTADNMIGWQIKHFGPLRKGGRLLYLETVLAAANGDPQRAAKSVTASLALAESLQDRPVLVSYFVGKAHTGLTISSLEQALSRTEFTEQQLIKLSIVLEEVEATNCFKQALIGEQAWDNENWNGIRAGKVHLTDMTRWSDEKRGELDRVVAFIYRPSGLVDLDYYTSLNLLRDLINSSSIPFPLRFERVDSLKRSVENLRVCPLTRMEAKLLSDATIQDGRFIAQLRTVCTSLGIERYRLANGALPDSLGNLLPVFLKTVPIDPFDGQPLRYRKLAKGYVVYSVGEDGKDDGGVEPRHGYTPGSDLTFIVER